MKHVSLVAAGLLAAAAVAVPAAFAVDFLPAQSDTEYLAKDHFIGAKVHGPDGKIVGDIEDVIINENNQVVGVVLGTGGYFGFAEKKIGLSLSSLTFEDKDGKLSVTVADLTKEAIEGAPEFQRKQPPKSLFERSKEKVRELTDKTRSSTESAIDAAKPAYDEAKQKAKEALDKAKEAAAPAIEKAKEAVSGAIDSAKEAVDDAMKPSEPAPDAPAAPTAPAAPEQPSSPANPGQHL